MKEQFEFSDITYEHIGHESSMPFRTFLISVGYRGWHWHRELELILVLEGELKVTKRLTTHTLSKGDIYLINPYEMHGFIDGNKKNILLVLQIDPIISSACPIDLQYFNFMLNAETETSEKIITSIKIIMIKIIKEVIYKKIGYEFACMGEVNKLVTILIRNVENNRDEKKEFRNRLEWLERINKIMKFINDNHKKNITLDDLGNFMNLSPFYISHLIKENTGLSFREHLSLIRTHFAISLMLSSDKKIIEIAYESGFSDIKYFNKNFKRIYSLTPSQLRKQKNWKELISNRINDSEISNDIAMELIKSL